MSGLLNKIGSRSGKIWAGQAREASTGGGGAAPTWDTIADGAISDGAKCILREDGKVSGLPSEDASALYGEGSTGDEVHDNGNKAITAYDTTTNKIICMYNTTTSGGNWNKAALRHGTVDGATKTITWSNEVILSVGQNQGHAMCVDSHSGIISCFFRDTGNSFYCSARLAKVVALPHAFDTSSIITIESAVGAPYAAEYDEQNQRVILVWNGSSYNTYAQAFSQSSMGSSLYWTPQGSKINLNISSLGAYASAWKPGSGGGMLFAGKWGNYSMITPIYLPNQSSNVVHGTDKFLDIGNSSGTSTSYDEHIHAVYDPDTGNFLVTRKRGAGMPNIYPHADARDTVSTVVEVGGSSFNSFSVKATVKVADALPDPGSGTGYNFGNYGGNLGYHEGENKYICAWYSEGDTDNGWVKIGHIVSGQIVWSTGAYKFSSTANMAMFGPSAVWDPDEGELILFYNNYSTNHIEATFIDPSVALTNLTASNFIGIADGAYADGTTAKIQMRGHIDDAQSGLTIGTEYFVRSDGTLATTADAIGSIPAGKALSSTKILIK